MRVAMIAGILTGLVGLAIAGGPPPGAPYTGPFSDQTRVCNMQDSVQAEPGLEREYQGKTYHFCCEGCANSFDGDPKKYVFTKDPVNGAEVDKATALMFVVKNHVYYFGSAKTRDAFAKEPGKYLTGS
jgi:Cu+-exporting ATPase